MRLNLFFEAAEALKDHGDIEFVMVGDGALKEQFQKRMGIYRTWFLLQKFPGIEYRLCWLTPTYCIFRSTLQRSGITGNL